MTTLPFQLDVLWLVHDADVQLAIPLLFPELSALGPAPAAALPSLLRNVEKRLREMPAEEVFRRQPHELPEIRSLMLEVDAPGAAETRLARESWRVPAGLRFQYALWQHDSSTTIAYVPVLDIEVILRPEDDMEGSLRREILAAIRRGGMPTTLRQLVWLQHCDDVSLERKTLNVEFLTPKERVLEDREDRAGESLLGTVISDVTAARHCPVYERDGLVATLADYLTGRSPRSVLLVGASDVGKTAMVHELIRRRGQFGLGHTPFWATSGARLVAGACGFGMWEERCGRLCREAARCKAVLHLGGLVELLQVGKAEGQEQSVGDYLATPIERGDLLAIAECTAEEYARLEQVNPRPLRAFVRLDVAEPTTQQGRAILTRCAARWQTFLPGRCSDEALETLDRLHRRYATYSAYPGRPLRFLRRLLERAEPPAVITPAQVTAAFSQETGLPRVLLDDALPLDLARTRTWLRDRIIGQPEAVEVVVDLLASIKAGMVHPRQPIASLLFAGPTGVGKTEMAKALAEYLYQDRRRMLRVDMSEYADAAAVDRLIGGVFGVEGILTGRVREQPFGVVLLDEFEKAHPRLYDLLLQVLGEGRLTDASGKLADFRNAVIIMTSNLGTESFRRDALGFGTTSASGASQAEHFLQAVRAFMRPELFNRIDRIVPFAPLSQEALLRIAARELQQLESREGILHRKVKLEFAADVASQLVALGYDPRYGARPLKRAIDRHLVAPLAAALADRSAEDRLTASVRVQHGRFRVRVKAEHAAGREALAGAQGSDLDVVQAATDLRREAFRVQQSTPVLSLRNQIYRLERQQQRLARKDWRRAAAGRQARHDVEPARMAESLQEQVQQVDRVAANSGELEELVLDAHYGGEVESVRALTDELGPLRTQLDALYLELYCRQLPDADQATLVVYSKFDNPRTDGVDRHLFELVQSYRACAAAHACRSRQFLLLPYRAGTELQQNEFRLGDPDSDRLELVRQANRTRLKARALPASSPFLDEPDSTPIGIALEWQGAHVLPRMAPEEGIHLFGNQGTGPKYLVHVSSQPMRSYRPPARIDEPAGMEHHRLRRVYSMAAAMIEDKALGTRQHWNGKRLAAAVQQLCEARFLRTAKEWLHGD